MADRALKVRTGLAAVQRLQALASQEVECACADWSSSAVPEVSDETYRTCFGTKKPRCRRCHSEQLSNHLARVNVPGKHLVNQTGPTPAPARVLRSMGPEIESYLAALAAFDASTLSSHLFVRRDIRSSASDSSDRSRAMHGGTSASSGSGGDPSCPSPTADLHDGSRHFFDHWSSGRSCVRSTSAGVSSAKQCG